MQNTKDTFLMALRDRLATVNPERTCVVRGMRSPAVLAEENELVRGDGELPAETFVLRWMEPAMDETEAMPMVSLPCEIAYWTEGSALAAGMDRGRVLSAMDGELRQMLQPGTTRKRDYSSAPATDLQTFVFWGEVSLDKTVMKGSRMSRVAQVTVLGIEEAGEA